MANVTDNQLKEYTEMLDQGVKALVRGPDFKRYLNVMAMFHNYSANNSLLIMMQKPDATRVASLTTWNKLGRHVVKGEKGIRIIAPAPFKTHRLRDRIDANTGLAILGTDGKPIQDNVEVIIPNYKIVTVFDLSQTEGKELPEIVHELPATKEDFSKMLTSLHIISPVPIEFETITTGANGYYSIADKRIAIRDGMSQTQTIKTVVHEVAHSMIHSQESSLSDVDSRTREVQAESIAYVVCTHFGIDTSEYSFGYIGSWSTDKELPELKESISVIRSTSATIINGIERELALFHEKEEALSLATEIDQFVRDLDVYGYEDVVVSRVAMIDSLAKDLRNGNTDYILKWMDIAIHNAASEEDISKAVELKEKILVYTKPQFSSMLKDQMHGLKAHHTK